jgi:sulfofructose kinase
MFDVLGIGVAAVDDLVRVPHLPAPDTKVRVTESVRACGGLCATALVAAARLGASVAYAGVVGPDDLSDFVLRSLEAEGIDTSHVDRLPDAGPAHSIIVVDPAGRRTVYSDPRRSIAGADDRPPASVLRDARVLLVDHVRIPASIRAARIARWEGIPVVADIERDDDPRLPELLAAVDHLVVPAAFGERLTGASDPGAILAALRSPGRTTVLTAGADGAWYLGPGEDDRPSHAPAFAVDTLDTTGCGDAFHGAYAAGLAFGLDLAGRVRLASAVAALTATRLGGQAGIPDRAAVEAFLAARPAAEAGRPGADPP